MPNPAQCCLKALQDATARWPNRKNGRDGIMGDEAHQKRKSDHNDGNAFDLTYDPEHGVDCEALSKEVINDERVTYVIWNGHIFNRERAKEGWREYKGTDPHDHHMHVSIKAESRDDLSEWPWSYAAGYRPFRGPLWNGSKGARVQEVEQRLRDLGYEVKVDTVYGPDTRDAVKAFQRDHAMAQDGVVGRKTWAVLMAGPALRSKGVGK